MLPLRARVILGALFWTIGLVIMATAVMVVAFEDSSDFRAFVAIHNFFKQPLVLLVALLSLVAGFFQVRRGVSRAVADIDALQDHREQAVRRAVGKAGDLAHGLKTPLAVLAREAERAAAAGQPELAAAIGQQVERMRRQIDYHLAHARAAASGAMPGARCSIRESADGLARTLLRLHADRQLTIDVRIDPSHAARVQREDLDEMLGNLLDNACKWTRTTVVVDSSEDTHRVVITVDDDGAGLPAAMREAVLGRGVRADEQAPGSGLGLAIVRDLAEIYQGSIALHDSPLGGLRATLTLPRI